MSQPGEEQLSITGLHYVPLGGVDAQRFLPTNRGSSLLIGPDGVARRTAAWPTSFWEERLNAVRTAEWR